MFTKAYQKLSLLKINLNLVYPQIFQNKCMYFFHRRSQLDYTVELWSGCTQFDIDKLEKVKSYAARIATGLSVIASTNSLYLGTGREPLLMTRPF